MQHTVRLARDLVSSPAMRHCHGRRNAPHRTPRCTSKCVCCPLCGPPTMRLCLGEMQTFYLSITLRPTDAHIDVLVTAGTTHVPLLAGAAAAEDTEVPQSPLTSVRPEDGHWRYLFFPFFFVSSCSWFISSLPRALESVAIHTHVPHHPRQQQQRRRRLGTLSRSAPETATGVIFFFPSSLFLLLLGSSRPCPFDVFPHGQRCCHDPPLSSLSWI